jgi:hypothetical protein
MRDATTTRTGLILPPPLAETLTGWLDDIADAELDHYTSDAADQVDDTQPLDASHGARAIAQACFTTADAKTGVPRPERTPAP